MAVSSSSAPPMTRVESKVATEVQQQEESFEAVEAYQNPWHTTFDRSNMQRLGKRQEYRRVFGPVATFGFISMYLATWECTYFPTQIHVIKFTLSPVPASTEKPAWTRTYQRNLLWI